MSGLDDQMIGRVLEAVSGSGFPFELEVAEKVTDAIAANEKAVGLRVFQRPSITVRDHDEDKDHELDVSVEANRLAEGNCAGGAMNLGIECKDSNYPYLCFGSPLGRAGEQQIVDARWAATPSTGSTQLFRSGLVRAFREATAGQGETVNPPPYMFHMVRSLKPRKEGQHTPTRDATPLIPDDEIMRTACRNLAVWTREHSLAEPCPASPLLEVSLGGPAVYMHHAILVTRLSHCRVFRREGRLEHEVADYTPIHLSRTYRGRELRYVVHLVSLGGIAELIDCVVSDFKLACGLAPAVFGQLAKDKRAARVQAHDNHRRKWGMDTSVDPPRSPD